MLRARATWLAPLLIASIVVGLMTAIYLSAVANPRANLRALPVEIVNQDRGAMAGSQHVDFGAQVVAGLSASPQISGPLQLTDSSLPAAQRSMGTDGAYATVVIPSDFSTTLLAVAGVSTTPATTTRPEITILTNERAGATGVSLATAYLEPALDAVSKQIGQKLATMSPGGGSNDATRVLLADPVAVTTSNYDPLPANTALGLSAFYVALLTLMSGFLSGGIINSSVDGALGFAPNELGPRWRQRPPQPITRWRTLLIKWAIAVMGTAVVTAIMVVVAAAAVRVDVPDPITLWLFAWLSSASVSAGTIVLLAVLGTPGQLVAVLAFVYLGLASAGGTVPVQALPGFFQALSQVEPLRQILGGVRAILYFGAQGDAGLAHGAAAAAIALVAWVVIGTVLVRWYDRRKLFRMQPDLLEYLGGAVQGYRDLHGSSRSASTGPGGLPSGLVAERFNREEATSGDTPR